MTVERNYLNLHYTILIYETLSNRELIKDQTQYYFLQSTNSLELWLDIICAYFYGFSIFGCWDTIIIYFFLNIMKARFWSRLPDVQHSDYPVTLDYISSLPVFSLPFHPNRLNEMVIKCSSIQKFWIPSYSWIVSFYYNLLLTDDW